ncbi:hypothetical protein [Pseudomonas sp. Teo4]|uniref:hypothetical protein n=1 Tax=Pseudomonas sp. Teo4 TaxID=3064528 RepID=UPI002AB9BD03|nr:hypothetical protein [Pseudomonas sp. Teo4]MDZ3992394.1 hypothetical protein [Pseudomonas sp. Teo4]
MSAIHEQAMHNIYKQVYERLCKNMSQAQHASLQLLVQRLLVAAGGLEYIGSLRLLVLQGNDRSSARLLATLRAAQLSIALRAPETFQLRVLVACLPAPSPPRPRPRGSGSGCLDSHQRLFNTLFLDDDVRVELQMIDGCEVVPFCCKSAKSTERWALARNALLLFSHLIDARPEALFGSRIHLELADALRLALSGQQEGDVVVTAMPARQRRRYLSWARRTLRLAGEHGLRDMPQSLAGLFEGLGALHGVAGTALERGRSDQAPAREQAVLRVIAVDDLLPQMPVRDQLDEFLNCPESASDGKPLSAFLDPLAIMHLHEVRTHGIQTNTPRDLLQLARSPTQTKPEQPDQDRFDKTYGITQTQIACALFSPIANHGRDLERYLQCRHREMLVALPYLHRALQGKPCPEPIKDWLIETSGLTLGQLRAIYEGRIRPASRRMLANLARRDVQLRLLRQLPASAPSRCKASP